MAFLSFFFFNDTATTEIYTLSLHDALPISWAALGTTAQLGLRASPVRTWSQPKDRKSTRLNSSHVEISYAVFCLKKKKAKLQMNPFSVASISTPNRNASITSCMNQTLAQTT